MSSTTREEKSSKWNIQSYVQQRHRSELASAFQCQYCHDWGTRIIPVLGKLYHPSCASKVMTKLINPITPS